MRFLVMVHCIKCGKYSFRLWAKSLVHVCKKCQQKTYTCPYTGSTITSEDGGKATLDFGGVR